MKILVEPIEAGQLKPGDLFTSGDQKYWDNLPLQSIGEGVFIRTNNPTPQDEQHLKTYKLQIIYDENEKKI